MKKILILILGLILIGVLTYFCFENKIGTIKQELETSANNALISNNFTDVKAKLVGDGFETTTIMKLTGNASSTEAKDAAGSLAGAVIGVSGVDNQLIVKQETLASIPEDLESLEDISPEPQVAPEPEIQQEKVKIPSPYTFSASKDKNGHIILDGYIDSEDTHMDVIAQASELFGSKNITDNLKVIKGAPDNWDKVTQFNLSKLKDVDYGDVQLRDTNYAFNGFISSKEAEKIKISLLSAAKSTMDKYSDYSGNFEVTTPKPKEVVKEEPKSPAKESESKEAKESKLCQKELVELSTRQKIQFEYNKSNIKKDDTKALDNVVKLLKECSFKAKEILEIGGHTDSIGNATYNKKLSQARADSVKNYLTQHGIEKDKLVSLGFGEKKPIVSNMLKEGRAKNRRIEFKIKEVK